MTLREVLEAAAAGVPDAIPVTESDGSMIWSVGATAFAKLSADGSTASFLLDPLVAGAAVRTPDVALSPRDPDWIELRPRILDGHAADRATAWLLSGHRRLTQTPFDPGR